MYRTKRCRCVLCRAANAEQQYELRLARSAKLAAGEVDPPHGTDGTYSNYGCRCEDCVEAHTEANFQYHERKIKYG